MKRPSPHFIALIGLAFLVTFLIGWKLAPEPPVASVGSDEAERKTGTVSRERPSRNDSSVSRKMNRIRNGANQLERTRAAISLAMALPPSEFAAWVEGDRFSARNGPELSIFRMIIFERWIAEDPDGLIAWGVKNDYGQAGRGLDQIAKHDPERLIAYFREHPNEGAEMNQLKDIAKDHPSLALARLKELHESGMSSESDRANRELLLAISKDSTAELEAALFSLPESMREGAESVIFGRKLEKDFAGEIGKLLEHPGGSRILLDNLGLLKGKAGAILAAIPNMPDSWKNDLANSTWRLFDNGEGKEWMNADLEAHGFSAEQAEQIRWRGLHSLSYRDPAFVLNNIRDVEKDRQAMDSAISSLLRRSNGEDGSMEKLLAGITSPEVRAAAAEQVEAARMLKAAAFDQPSDWLRTLGALDSSATLARSFGSSLSNLDGQQLKDYRESFREMSGEVKNNAAISIAKSAENSQHFNEMHGDALKYLAENPPVQNPGVNGNEKFEITRAASEYTVRLAANDPVAASEWVGSLPDGPSRQWAAKNLATHWNQYDPGAVTGWMKTLPPEERKLVQSHLEKSP